MSEDYNLNNLFSGVVASSDAGTYNVQVEPKGDIRQSRLQGIPLVSVFASTLGFKECPQIPVGCHVVCLRSNAQQCFILGIIPDHDTKTMEGRFFARTALKTADPKVDLQNTLGYLDEKNETEGTRIITHNQNRATDVVEGEHVVMNDFGVLLGLFQQMAQLKGSELSQIQCYVLDDLVRLISHNFQHFTAMGEFNVWHDGKAIMAELGATHLSGESLGIPQVDSFKKEPVFKDNSSDKPTADDVKDYYEFLGNEKAKAIERLKVFTGRLGDFLHMFLVRPDEDAIRLLSGEFRGMYDKGLFDVHVSVDGRLSVRTVTGISIEKTNWIRVPHRVRTPEDPQGDDGEKIVFEDKDPFEFDNSITNRDNPTMHFLQIRDCVAYLQDYYSYKNFQKYVKDFKLSQSPDDNEKSLSDIKKVDPNTKVDFSDYVLRRSGLYFLDNGGIMLKNAWGAAIVLDGPDILLQPARDLVVQPMRHSVTKAGGSIQMAARDEVDISSTEKGFRLKTKNAQHLYSSDEGIILQSDSKLKSVPTPNGQAYEQVGGIVLKAENTGVWTYADTIFDHSVSNSYYKSDKNLAIKGTDMLCLQGDYLLATPAEMILAPENAYIIPSNTAICAGAEETVIGLKGQTPVIPAPDQEFVSVQTGILEDAMDIPVSPNPEDWVNPYNKANTFTDIKFRFLASDKYNLGEDDCIPQTIAQQDDVEFKFLNLKTWTEQEINDTLPFPGKDRFVKDYYVTCELKNLQKKDNDIFSKEVSSLESTSGSLTKKSLQEYKTL